MAKEIIDRHHLLEIILWPNGDGTFTEIRNSAERLQELGIYDDYKLTIPLTHSEHTRLHHAGKTFSAETRKKMAEAAKGRTVSEKTRQKMSVSHKGKSLSAETRKKTSDAMKAYYAAKRKEKGGV